MKKIAFPELEALPDAPVAASDIPAPEDIKMLQRPGPLIRRLHQIAVSVFLTHGREFELTPVQYGSLQLVAMYPGIPQAGLGKLLALDRQTISNVVQRLADKGLIIRKEKDARTSALYASGAAKALIQVMKERLSSVDATILGPLNQSEKKTFMELLQKLVDSNNELSRAPSGGTSGSSAPRRKKKQKSA
ncbi:MAG: winged helix-turn-helix transcriptional regulator [Gammaproteobacteria bacterium]|nr:winged helix-turn-helix transcriptional regulator [Gammaproteobacteria bacterium]